MNERIKIWDLPTRWFHWSVVGLVGFELISGFGEYTETALDWHVWGGTLLAVLVWMRVVWGFLGPGANRFGDFVRSPRQVIAYLKGMLAGDHRVYLGHNPAGGIMILLLLLTLAGIILSGAAALGGQERHGPLAAFVTYAQGHDFKELHEGLAGLLVGLIGFHVAGVLLESLLLRENLIGSMLTGWRERRPAALLPNAAPARPLAALAVILSCGGLLTAGTVSLANLPPNGWHALEKNPTYETACGDCHWAFHPMLLPASSWQNMMTGLDDHFGEVATLPPAEVTAITTWLVANSRETWDMEASNRFRKLNEEHPLSITATPGWKKRHHDLEEDKLFALKKVGNKVNCPACHADAATGRFDNHSIKIPKE